MYKQENHNFKTMKKSGIIMSLLLLFTLVACRGDRGPQGPPGINLLGQVFETTVNFHSGNNFSNVINYPSNVEVYESDVVLVYLLEDELANNVDVWTPIPQTFFINGEGIMAYNFNYTFLDVNIFLNGDFPLGNLPPIFTQDQTFRIAVVPSEFADANLSMEELMASDTVQWLN